MKKLTEQQKRDIRMMAHVADLAGVRLYITLIAKHYGVSRQTIWKVLKGGENHAH